MLVVLVAKKIEEAVLFYHVVDGKEWVRFLRIEEGDLRTVQFE